MANLYKDGPIVVADVDASKPSNGFDGQFCYAKDTDTLYVWDGSWISISGGGGGGAPSTADYLVKTADAGLSAERVVTDTATITWDWGTAGQAKANFVGSAGEAISSFLLMGG
jgi:hypothetical protein